MNLNIAKVIIFKIRTKYKNVLLEKQQPNEHNLTYLRTTS